MQQIDIKFDRRLLGVEHQLGTFHVTRELIIAFARATGETNPAYCDQEPPEDTDLVAPSTFCNIFTSGSARPDIRLEFGDLDLFAGQAIECSEPVRAGDSITASTRLSDVYAKTGRSGKMVFAVWETVFTNQRDVVVARIRESFVQRAREAGG